MEDEDEYSLFDEPIMQDGPGLFDEEPEPVMQQDGPDLFGDDDPAAGEPAGDDDAASDVAPPPSRLATQPRPAAPDAPLALYRRYRPDTFADVIGQDHVTVPLQRALANNKVGHAYLFSGPRGCGKTTSARILARCLNCEQGPTATPCGECQSCIDLARGGPGSIDVIEIDAASHGGVDDARDLRERAFFAPVASRYKIYIVDEAHMVTAAGFNALLKLVEEPPPHAKFIFATTEPEKVIGTIRSRTHHYPFRLVPPRLLTTYLQEICEAEGAQVDPAVLPLVVRAGAGSVRDSLSVLDQLLGGAGEGGVAYEQAAALLGYTPESLLDDIVDAFAAGDSAGVFRTIDRVIEVGQDPRRFAEDLLRRLRDLVILAAVPTAIDDGILDVAADQGERLKSQASGLGAGELTRAAEVIATGLTAMRGTTAPRLHLELMCARVLLPGADLDERGLHARMDRLERRVGMMGTPDGEPSAPQWSDVPGRATAVGEAAPADQPRESAGGHRESAGQAAVAPGAGAPPPASRQRPDDGPAAPHASGRGQQPYAGPQPEPADAQRAPAPQQRPAGTPPGGGSSSTPQQRPAGAPPGGQRPAGAPRAGGETSSAPAPQGGQQRPAGAPPGARPGQLTTEELRRAWPAVLEEVKRRRRFTYMLLSQNSQVQEVADGLLVLGFANAGARDNFGHGGSQDLLIDAIIEVLGVELRVQGVVANERIAERGQRRSAGQMPSEPPPDDHPPAPRFEPVEPPVRGEEPRRDLEPPSAPQAPVDIDDPAYSQTSDDDRAFDGLHNAEELLGKAFGAEIIEVREDGPRE